MESGWNVWMWLVGVATGCGCKEGYRFPHTTYPYSSCICSFLQQHPYFLFIFLMFFVLYIYILVIHCNLVHEMGSQDHQLKTKEME